MKAALIFLNGFYDTRYLDFYQREIKDAVKKHYPLICADGGIRLFDQLNQQKEQTLIPDILIGDLDSIQGKITETKHTVEKWVGQTDKDYTDGQLAVEYAIKQCNCRHIIIYGGLPRPNEYETDHFLGNLKLMRFGNCILDDKNCDYKAEMRDPKQTIHYVQSDVRLYRNGSGLQRVSLIADETNVVVERSQNLRWDLTSLHIHPDLTNALRNEFIDDAKWAEVQLTETSAPVYVIHNWYD